MEEVRQLVQEEGREARNLVAFHVAVDTPARVSRKPPRAVPPARRAPPRAPRLRSASAGRDKRSDMRARYWALLFGDLHRSVGEIYNFVDANENLNECQEVILVLENYTRDFKALGEWFRLKWEYDNTPPPQRPQSLAWEIRKTDFVRLDFRRAYSVKSSPSVSGKNSPCFSGHNTPSGKNSPNLTGKASPGSGKVSPRISSTHSSTSPKANIEFFSNKIVASKITAIPEPKVSKETTRLSEIKERDLKETQEHNQNVKITSDTNDVSDKIVEKEDPINTVTVELGKAKEIPNETPKHVVIISPKHNKSQTSEPTKLPELKQRDVKSTDDDNQAGKVMPQLNDTNDNSVAKEDLQNIPIIEIGTAKQITSASPKQVLIKSSQHTKLLNTEGLKATDIQDKNSKDTCEDDQLVNVNAETNDTNNVENEDPKILMVVEGGKAKEIANALPKQVVIKSPKHTKLQNCSSATDAKDKHVKDTSEDNQAIKLNPETNNTDDKIALKEDRKNMVTVEIGKAKEIANVSPKPVVVKSPKHANTDIPKKKSDNELSSQAKATIAQLDAMENEFLEKQLLENSVKNENVLNQDKEVEKNLNQPSTEMITVDVDDKQTSNIEKTVQSPIESPTKSEDNFADISNESSPKSSDEKPPDVVLNTEMNEEKNNLQQPEIVKDLIAEVHKAPKQDENDVEQKKPDIINNNNDEKKETVKEADVTQSNDITQEHKVEQDLKKTDSKTAPDSKPIARPAYSTAAAKPKSVNALKSEVKTPLRSTTLSRSSTVVELRPNTALKTHKPFQRKNQTSKCSYPFNLTTGRKSLFDNSPATVNKAPLLKRPFNRNTQMASGDNKMNSIKPDVKKRPPRPTSLKINEKGDKKAKNESNNPALKRIKDCEEYSSCDTIVTQIDMSRIDSSESLKTLVPEDMMQDVGNSVEVLAVDDKKDNEGWLTVKSKRCTRESKKQSKSHWANRFHQPSATTSLPTLNMLVSPKQETKSLTDAPTMAKTDRAQSEQPQKIEKPPTVMAKIEVKPKEPEQSRKIESTEPKVVKVEVKSKAQDKPKDPAMIRQKSDVTGLKTRSSKSKVLTKRAEKVKDPTKDEDSSDLIKNRLHSSLESLTTGLARSQESTEEAFDFDKWKAEFKSTFNFLDDDEISDQNELLMSADPSEMSEIAEMTSQIEENERKISLALDFQSEVDQRKLCEEEDLLNRQIMELQQVSDIDLDTETDDTETDAEILCEDPISVPQCPPENLGSLAASLEDQYETALAGMSWAERMDALVTLEALVARDPGRAQQLHSKLSQGIRRRGSLQDVLRRIQAKQARADRQRQQLRTERANKIHQLLARVEEVKFAKNQLTEEKRLRMERRLQKAAENRDQHLKDRVRKAHDEEEKLREIAFIKQLQAENRRHDFLAQCRSHTTRLRQRRREQLQKLEEKAAREAAVGARRQALQAARQQHVASLLARRRERDARVSELRELRRQERGDAAREKAEGVKSRLSALAAAAKQEEDALRSRIRDKQDASQQRLESHLQAIREKATGPRQATTSESQDQATKDMEEAERLEQERKDREKQKAIKKKARKLKQKLLASGNTRPVYEDNVTVFDSILNPFANKITKIVNTINNIIKPLQEDDKPSSDVSKENGFDHDEQRNRKKNKKLVNGEAEEVSSGDKKRKKKSKESSERELDAEVEKIVNGDVKPEKEKRKKKSKESVEREIDELERNNNSVTASQSKKKKKNSESERKLTKTSSVCSSLSDMSRSSVREVRPVAIDVTFLERQLNELHRIVEKLGGLPDKRGVYQSLTVRAASGLLAAAADRDDLAAQFTAKCLSTAVTLISRAVGSCGVSAAHLVTTNTCVHLIKLLSDQLDKDLTSDPKEMELARQLTDCLSLALDSVLCSTRIYEDKQARGPDEQDVLGTLRNRAHSLISYFCLCGCLGRAEKAGEARESIQTLLTVCADLCHPCDADIGSERLSAKQSLRCALGTSVLGSRAEFCMLFDRGADLGQCGDFVRAARTAHLLRAIAEMDHQIVQEAFGEGGWPLEFRAAVARLLSQHAPNEKEAPRSVALRLSNQRLDQTLSETMVLDLIVLVGFVVVNNPQLQETICDGWSVIKTLCTLPANWLHSRAHSSALLPTLVALADAPSARVAIAAEVNMEILEEFMESPDAQQLKLVQVIKQARNKKPGKK
ncbi:uncharacterized protein ssp3 [Epargyreus clarus]|uniref:uncharacterized protein ssp3 n=1 Tax=Epargyreus clarus TaxID=520877 RepID=UPI003C2D79EA